MRHARGEMAKLAVLDAPPPMPARFIFDLEGQEATLMGAYSGEVVVLNLWATWCAPCIEEMPTLAALQQRFDGRGVDVVVVSVDSEPKRADAAAMLARLSDGTLDFWIDPSRGILFDVAAPGMPVTLIYDRNRREVARLAGGADWGGDEAAAVIEAVFAEQ